MQVQWLGINSFRFNFNGKIILLDPYVSRNSAKICDREAVARYVPAADYVFISHSHWDHLADAAEICRQTNALIIGSETTLNICRCQGVPQSRLRLFKAGDTLDFDDFKVDFYASMHKQPMLYPGEYKRVPEKIDSIEDFFEGGTFVLRFYFGPLKVVNVGSANFIRESIEGVECDYLLAGIAGRSESYLKGLVECLHPKVVVPTHFDPFETPLEENRRCFDMEAFAQELKAIDPAIEIIIPEPLRTTEFN